MNLAPPQPRRRHNAGPLSDVSDQVTADRRSPRSRPPVGLA